MRKKWKEVEGLSLVDLREYQSKMKAELTARLEQFKKEGESRRAELSNIAKIIRDRERYEKF